MGEYFPAGGDDPEDGWWRQEGYVPDDAQDAYPHSVDPSPADMPYSGYDAAGFEPTAEGLAGGMNSYAEAGEQ